MKEAESESQSGSYKGGVVDKLLLNVFRNKMVQQVGWDSDKPGYDGLIEVANRMMLQNPTNSHTKEAAVLYSTLISMFQDTIHVHIYLAYWLIINNTS